MKVEENDISGKGKQGFIKLLEIPCLPGDVKLHHHGVLFL
jgi:hypothetical protein